MITAFQFYDVCRFPGVNFPVLGLSQSESPLYYARFPLKLPDPLRKIMAARHAEKTVSTLLMSGRLYGSEARSWRTS
jgi:hypothetical protein